VRNAEYLPKAGHLTVITIVSITESYTMLHFLVVWQVCINDYPEDTLVSLHGPTCGNFHFIVARRNQAVANDVNVSSSARLAQH
jgi:hypothetical protein